MCWRKHTGDISEIYREEKERTNLNLEVKNNEKLKEKSSCVIPFPTPEAEMKTPAKGIQKQKSDSIVMNLAQRKAVTPSRKAGLQKLSVLHPNLGRMLERGISHLEKFDIDVKMFVEQKDFKDFYDKLNIRLGDEWSPMVWKGTHKLWKTIFKIDWPNYDNRPEDAATVLLFMLCLVIGEDLEDAAGKKIRRLLLSRV